MLGRALIERVDEEERAEAAQPERRREAGLASAWEQSARCRAAPARQKSPPRVRASGCTRTGTSSPFRVSGDRRVA